MMRIAFIRCGYCFSVILVLAFFNPVKSQPGEEEMVDGTVIYRISREKSSPDERVKTFINQLDPASNKPMFPHADRGLKSENASCLSSIYILKYNASQSPQKVAAYLASLPGIAYAQPRYRSRCFSSPNDPLLSSQYYLDKIGARAAWDYCTGDSTVIIGISDTGFDLFHDDLVGRIAYNRFDSINGIDDDNDGYIDNFRGWNFVAHTNDATNRTSNHGTQVAGICAAQPNNKKGIAGVAYNCKILPVRITNDVNVNVFDFESIVYMVNHGAKVINCSWGGFMYQPMGQDVIDYAVKERDVVVVAAAGNSNSTRPVYPASLDNVLSVAATTQNDQKWTPQNMGSSGGSSYGSTVGISAPGVMMQTLDLNNGYSTGTVGTSYASPVVAGAAALVRSRFPALNAMQVVEQLKATADNIDTIPYNAPYRNMLGAGRVNILKAITDTTQPGIRFVDNTIRSRAGTELNPGDTVMIDGCFINYLHRSDSVYVNVSEAHGYLRVLNPHEVIEPLATNMKSRPKQFLAVIAKTVPLDVKIDVLITYKTPGYSGYQYVSFTAYPSFVTLEKNNILTSVTSSGSIGFARTTSLFKGHGFTYKGLQLLHEASLVLANDTNEIILDKGTTNNYFAERSPLVTRTGGKTTISTSYTGRFLSSVDFMFAVNQRVSAWDNDSSFILYEYEIVNNSLSRVNHLNAGLYLDWSVGNPLINLAYVDTLKQYGTVYSVDKTLPYCGAKLLTHSRVNQFIIESADESDPRIVASNGISNTELVYAMTHQKSKMNVSKYLGTGITQIINIKDVSLEVNDTLRFAAILFATDREEHIISILERATLHYQNTVATVNEQGNDTAFEVSILPTIVSTEMVEALLVTPVEGLATVDLVDGTGVLLSRRGVNVSRGHNKLRIPLPSTPGYYVLRCSQGSNYRSQVLVKQ